MSILNKIKNTDLFTTIRHSAVFFSSNMATQAVSFLLLPFLTRMLSEEGMGYIELFKSYMFIGATFLSLNSYASVSRYYFEKKKDFKEFIGTTILLVILVFTFFSLIIVPLNNQIADIADLPQSFPFYLIFASFFIVILRIFQQIVIPDRRSKDDLIISLIRGGNLLILTLILVSILEHEKYIGFIWALLITGLIVSVAILIKIRKEFKFSFKLSHIKYIFNYSVPLLPYHISAILLAHLSRIMLNNIEGAASAGIYSVAVNIGMIISVVNLAVNRAIIPDFFKFYDNMEFKRLDQLIRKMFSLVCVAALVFILFSEEILLIMASGKYDVALPILPIIYFTYLFDSIYQIYARYIMHSKKTIYLSISLIIAGIITLLLNIKLIPEYGFKGGAIATFISYFILSVIVWLIAKMILKYKVTNIFILIKPLLITALLGFIFIYINSNIDNNLIIYPLKLFLILLFMALTLKNEILKILK